MPCKRDSLSPAQKLDGHLIQDSLPAHRRSFAPEWKRPVDAEHADQVLYDSRSYYDQHAHSLPDLAPGAHVAIQNPTSKAWDIYGTVTAVTPYRRYFICTRFSQVLVCNRRFFRKRTALSVHAPTVHTPAPQEVLNGNVEPPPVPDTAPTVVTPRRSGRKRQQPARLIEEF